MAYSNSFQDAKNKRLVGVGKNNQVAIRIGSHKYQELRDSTRLVSKKKYNVGTLIIFDVAAMPAVCGTWPSIWMTGGESIILPFCRLLMRQSSQLALARRDRHLRRRFGDYNECIFCGRVSLESRS